MGNATKIATVRPRLPYSLTDGLNESLKRASSSGEYSETTLAGLKLIFNAPNAKLTNSRRKKASAANRASGFPVTLVTERAGGCWVERLVRHSPSDE